MNTALATRLASSCNQAVRSVKKRDNKREENERRYSTLDDAPHAHRLKILSGATATHRRSTRSLQRADVPASSSIVTAPAPSSPAPSVEPQAAMQPCVSVAPSSASSHADDQDARDGGLVIQHQQNELHPAQSTAHPLRRSTPQPQQLLWSPLLEEMEEMHSLLRQLSDGTSRMQSQLTAVEGESNSVRTQLKSCHELLNGWMLKVATEADMTDCAQPASSSAATPRLSACAASAPHGGASTSAGDAPSSSSLTPMPVAAALAWESRESNLDHEDSSPSVAASSLRAGHDTWVDQADTHMAVQSGGGGDGVDEPRKTGLRMWTVRWTTRARGEMGCRAESECG